MKVRFTLYAVCLLLIALATHSIFSYKTEKRETQAILDARPNSASFSGISNASEKASAVTNNEYILHCDSEPNEEIDPANIEILSNGEEVNNFKNNPSFATQFAYALSFEPDKIIRESGEEVLENNMTVLQDLLLENTQVDMVHYFMLLKCGLEVYQPLCDENIIDAATDSDPNNGALWLQVASLAAANGDIAQAALALEELIGAPNFNEYWAESIEVFDEALLATVPMPESSRIAAVIGHAASISLPYFSIILKFCREHSETRADIGQLCLDAGQKIVANSKQSLGQAIGFSLQKVVYKSLADKENLERIQQLSNRKMDTYFNSEANNLMLFDSNLLRYWFTQLKLFGEKESFRLLHEEAVRLSSNPDYNPCHQR